MAETLIVNKSVSLDEQYRILISQIKSLLSKNENLISNLSNLTAAINQTFEKVSWVGIYLFDGEKLYLGPFQGKIACTEIQMGKGVCGTAAKKMETVIVENVDLFPGHIACDADSKSEIVIPIIKKNKLFGVLDLDSTELNSFNVMDKKYLEEICSFLASDIIN